VLVEEITKPPPPPEVAPPPPPKLEAPPPPYIPPPEVQVAVPPPPAPTITAVPTPPPPAPVVIAPLPPAPAAPAPPAAPAQPSVGTACPGYEDILRDGGVPREAKRAEIDTGDVMVSFTVGPNGEVKNVAIKSSTHRVFNRHSVALVSQFKCIGQGRDVEMLVPLSFRPER
jgi:protein TonB